MFSKLWTFFAEDDGMGSMSRLMSFISMSLIAFWVSHVVLHTHSIPDLHNPAYFLTAGNVLYIGNKIHAGATAIFGPSQTPTTSTTTSSTTSTTT
jgi:hypothetical protein